MSGENGAPTLYVPLVGSKKLELAKQLGYVIEGYSIIDYMAKAAVDQEFNGWFIWGPLGRGKSNLALQLSFLFYRRAKGVTSDDHAWRIALDRLVISKSELLDMIKSIEDEGKRYPLVVWDDVGAYLPSVLYHEDPDLYNIMKKRIQLIRAHISNIVMTAPEPGDVAKFLIEKRNFDIIMKAKVSQWIGAFMLEAIVILIDYNRAKTSRAMVLLEDGTFPFKPGVPWRPKPTQNPRVRYPGVPSHIWEEYWRRRVDAVRRAEEETGRKTKSKCRGEARVTEDFIEFLRLDLPKAVRLVEKGEAVFKYWRHRGKKRLFLVYQSGDRKILWGPRTDTEARILEHVLDLLGYSV